MAIGENPAVGGTNHRNVGALHTHVALFWQGLVIANSKITSGSVSYQTLAEREWANEDPQQTLKTPYCNTFFIGTLHCTNKTTEHTCPYKGTITNKLMDEMSTKKNKREKW